MNTRVLELIKNPRIITEADLGILETESEKLPYAQSLRALYLYGINLYRPEDYKENLSKTAAYTTDKKILYQFINSERIVKNEIRPSIIHEKENIENQTVEEVKTEDIQPAEPALVNEIETTDNSSVMNKFDVEKIIHAEEIQNEEFIIVNGEKNRLLYDGEENFLEEKTPEVDLEASKESGLLTLKEETETVEKLIIIDENPSEETITKPGIENNKEDLIITESPESKPESASAEISFGGIQDFLPEVKFSVPKNHLDYLNPPKKDKKQENQDPETEKKPTYVEPLLEKELEIEDEHAVSFENTQAFEVSGFEKTIDHSENAVQSGSETEVSFEEPQEFEIVPDKIENQSIDPEKEIITEESRPEQPETKEWKPMQWASNIPDALIGKQPEQKIATEKAKDISVAEETKPEIIASESVDETDIQEKATEENTILDNERPVFNVSFFGNDVSKIEEKKETPHPDIEEKIDEQKESNVGNFINTWQSWLKIDRPKTEENPVKIKEKIIDNFIENNPKISQLKEESSFVIREKKDDISHLMTETLARLYTEQKLYTKAIKAYEILSEKHPAKKDYFQEKIEEIKEIRKP